MRWICRAACVVVCGAAAFAQNPEIGEIRRTGTHAVLMVDAPRPVDSAAMTLAANFGVAVSAEDPVYLQGSLQGGRLEVPFQVKADGSPLDLPGLLRDIVVAANAKFPFGYRLDSDGGRFTFVPTRTRESGGRIVESMPLLDRRVTIPAGTRPVHESAALLAEALSAQTGLRVNCCQGSVAGIPWGMVDVPFAAVNEPARSVLVRLIEAADPGRTDKTYWLERCDPLPGTGCFINLRWQ